MEDKGARRSAHNSERRGVLMGTELRRALARRAATRGNHRGELKWGSRKQTAPLAATRVITLLVGLGTIAEDVIWEGLPCRGTASTSTMRKVTSASHLPNGERAPRESWCTPSRSAS